MGKTRNKKTRNKKTYIKNKKTRKRGGRFSRFNHIRRKKWQHMNGGDEDDDAYLPTPEETEIIKTLNERKNWINIYKDLYKTKEFEKDFDNMIFHYAKIIHPLISKFINDLNSKPTTKEEKNQKIEFMKQITYKRNEIKKQYIRHYGKKKTNEQFNEHIQAYAKILGMDVFKIIDELYNENKPKLDSNINAMDKLIILRAKLIVLYNNEKKYDPASVVDDIFGETNPFDKMIQDFAKKNEMTVYTVYDNEFSNSDYKDLIDNNKERIEYIYNDLKKREKN